MLTLRSCPQTSLPTAMMSGFGLFERCLLGSLRQCGQSVSDQGNPSSAIIENRHGVGVLVGGW